MEKGTQIAYMPAQANGDINHPDVEFGFVMKSLMDGRAHICRYWQSDLKLLRTTAGGELTATTLMVEHVSVSQEQGDSAIAYIEATAV